jgi:hypothetical protein
MAQTTAGSQGQRGITYQAQAELTAIVAQAHCLARNGTAREARQSRTHGPNLGWVTSQRSQRGLPREKQAAASNTNGTVGSNGRNAPMAPSSKLSQPAAIHRTRRHDRTQGAGAGLYEGCGGRGRFIG